MGKELDNQTPSNPQVIREGEEFKIESINLVPGDLVRIQNSARIPADMVIVECENLRVNNDSLTGESKELWRSTNKTSEDPLETANLCFSGTTCTSGYGYGIVVNTGNQTVFGQYYRYKQKARAKKGPLATEIRNFLNYNAVGGLILSIIMFILSLILGHTLYSSFVSAVGIILACFPEGLVASVGVSIILASQRLKGKKVFVKNFETIEALGSVTCIITDENKILTEENMSVSSFWYSGEHKNVSVDYQTYAVSRGNFK